MFKIYIVQYFTIVLLGTAFCRFPRRRPHPSTLKPPPYLPPEVRERGQKIMSNVRIPNQRFCSEMDLSPANRYMVLPWWYNYCQNLKEKKERQYMNRAYYLPMYKNILDQANAYKKMMKKSSYRKMPN